MTPTPASPQAWDATDPTFPLSLREIPYPPTRLWTIGDRSIVEAQCVSIVGTRAMTHYGARVTRELVTALVRAGATVVSGMAIGVDATAHRTALEIGGRTVAVLGTGADVPYPPRHRALHAMIANAGLLISEALPGQRAFRGCFPRRNRLIAGLSRVTVVVEAGHKSGALGTALEAEKAHRIAAAVPGPIDAPRSAGTNRLIQVGAQIVTCVNDVLTLMKLQPQAEIAPTLAPAEQKLWDVLTELGQAPVELLATRTGLPLRETLTAITMLEIGGLITQDISGVVHRR